MKSRAARTELAANPGPTGTQGEDTKALKSSASQTMNVAAGNDLKMSGSDSVFGGKLASQQGGKISSAAFRTVTRDQYSELKKSKDKTVGVGHYKVCYSQVKNPARAFRFKQSEAPERHFLGTMTMTQGNIRARLGLKRIPKDIQENYAYKQP